MISEKGVHVKIKRDPSLSCYIVEVGSEFDCFRVAVDFVDLITLKNEIKAIEDFAKQQERNI